MTDIYFCNILPLYDKALFNVALDLASEYRREKVLRISHAESRPLSLGAGLLLRYALKGKKIPADSLKINVNKNGKPYFENSDLSFSLSHSGVFSACAISDTEVGVDIESVIRAKIKIAERFFSDDEAAFLQSVPKDKKELIFTVIWTQKESYAKCRGLSLLDVLKNGKYEKCFVQKGETELQSLDYSFKTVYLNNNEYVLSVCTDTGRNSSNSTGSHNLGCVSGKNGLNGGIDISACVSGESSSNSGTDISACTSWANRLNSTGSHNLGCVSGENGSNLKNSDTDISAAPCALCAQKKDFALREVSIYDIVNSLK